MRYRACREVGIAEIPCKVLPQDTPPEKLREYIIKDNNPYGENDWDALREDWDMDELDAWGMDMEFDEEREEEEKEAEEDGFDEAVDAVETVCVKGDVWRLGAHRLMCGDSTSEAEVALLMDGEKADLWLTDPPYNVAVRNSRGMTIANDDMDGDDFGRFLRGAFGAAKSAMKDGCPFYVWFASREHINFERTLNDKPRIRSLCLNPYSNGRWSASIVCFANTFHIWDVLILILMEDGLRALGF